MGCSRNRHQPYRRLGVLFLTVSLALSGCAQFGPELMKAGRSDYNKVLAQTQDEETLLNLVRLRYADNLAFMQVNSVSTSFNWNQGVQAEGFRFEEAGSDSHVGIRGNLDYSERPTITYTPLGGSDFVQNVLTPMNLDVLLLLSRSGWSIERLLRLTVNRMNGIGNAPEASGPTPSEVPEYEDFLRTAKLMRTLQKQRMVTLGYVKVGDETHAGLRFEPEFRETSVVKELSAMLGIDPHQHLVTLDTRSRLRRSNAIGFELRSLAGVMFFLSHGVQIPAPDIQVGRVTITRDSDGLPFDWSRVMGDLFVVHSQPTPPKNAAVAVNYRNNWFYVDDSDMQSKYTMMLLGQLTALQAGNIERAGPLLTLPVTGP
ncbi:MAG: hypothetical protein PVG22_05955 [Chromatiales bacterium]|jgi:hypothetical protein